MKQSKFQFSNPTIDKIDFKKNEAMQRKHHKFSYNIKNEVSIQRMQNDNVAKVILDFTLTNSEDDDSVYMNIVMSANFKWDDDTKKINVLLKQNAPALLLSYMRPIVSLIMAQSGFPNFNLPFVDFTHVES